IHFLVSSFPSIITPQIASGKFVSVGKTFMSSGIQSKTKVILSQTFNSQVSDISHSLFSLLITSLIILC
ncbi:MAG: hypothetical protein LBC61_07595, partial [Candidatus Peribacteria bacterium]|nr:hypothetical protein [Candidatus Peribacteria bacterium]